jgi:probable F420-dependent oxidoreductase
MQIADPMRGGPAGTDSGLRNGALREDNEAARPARGKDMQLGIHLPHAGGQATPELIRRAAIRAEALGLDDVWVSEHIIVPRASFPRSPLFYDPVLSLTLAAAVTKRVRLGTSVLVLPMRHPLPLAKELATLQDFSEGRLVLGAGVGWLAAEFAALGVPFRERGRRMDKGIAMMRAVWSEDPVTFRGEYIAAEIAAMTMMPHPVRPIPIWFGARSEAAYARAVRIGDGWHGSQLTPEEAAPIVQRLRRDRPEPEFTISMRTHWNGKDEGELRARLAAYREIGVQHVMVAPVDREIDDWDAVIEGAGRAVR